MVTSVESLATRKSWIGRFVENVPRSSSPFETESDFPLCCYSPAGIHPQSPRLRSAFFYSPSLAQPLFPFKLTRPLLLLQKQVFNVPSDVGKRDLEALFAEEGVECEIVRRESNLANGLASVSALVTLEEKRKMFALSKKAAFAKVSSFVLLSLFLLPASLALRRDWSDPSSYHLPQGPSHRPRLRQGGKGSSGFRSCYVVRFFLFPLPSLTLCSALLPI